jgi:hypothetical protein
METENDNKELEQMKGQLALLKEKLDKETIVNDKLMRKIMKTKMSKINRGVYLTEITAIFCIPFLTWSCIDAFAMPLWFVIVTDLFLVWGFIKTYLVHKDLLKKNLFDENLLEVGTKIMRMKKKKANTIKYNVPLLIIWYVGFILEMPRGDDYSGAIIGVVTGAVAGVLIGIVMYRKQQRTASEIIRQIQDLNGEETNKI